MTLSTGTKLAHYEINSQIGKGGMGEVYQAKDTKLGRDVAIKVLPEEFARDVDRVARFQREAKLLASLNHPNIAAIYGLEESEGTQFLVMELIDGDTLTDRLKRGPIPVEEALKLALQIAEALEAAHETGVVHRDLKPANIKVTFDGKVKVLDFGLAKAFTGKQGDVNLPDSPTLTAGATQQGVILGTAAYMSPEQAKGKVVDKRTDIWAFGAVLYEMLTGQAALQGEDVTEVLASAVKASVNLGLLPTNIHPRVNEIISRCLQKELKKRYQDIGDIRYEMEQVLEDPSGIFVQPSATVKPRKILRLKLPWVLTIAILSFIIGGLAVWYLKPSERGAMSNVTRLTVAVPEIPQGPGVTAVLALSPDGTKLVYASRNRLHLRSMSSLAAKPIPGTEGAKSPFFSPDGEWIGFFSQGKLWKVSVSGGTPQQLCDAATGLGGTWGSDDTIYFAPFNTSGIWKVSASGGTSQPVTTLDRAKGETSHRWPQILPGGKAVLFTVWEGPGWDEQHLEVVFLETRQRISVQPGGRTGRYVASGHLVYFRGHELMAVPFDLTRAEATDTPISLGIELSPVGEGAQFAVSDSGTLAYIQGSSQGEQRLVWVDRKGNLEPLPGPGGRYEDVTISPDGLNAAVTIEGATEGVWRYDLSRGTRVPLTTGGSCQFAVWMPQGEGVVYRRTWKGFRNLFSLRLDGSGQEEQLTEGENLQHPYSVSTDGRWLAYGEIDPVTGQDLWVLPLEGDGTAEVFLNTPFDEMRAQFSPNGRWLAYTSNETGQDEIWVRPFPGPGEGILISTEGGNSSIWSPDGRELFYFNGDNMMVVGITYEPTFTPGIPRLLFKGSVPQSNYNVSQDGQRFLMIQPSEPEQAVTQIHVVVNWFEELKERVSIK
jgi:serine/threonine protein kinase